MTEDTQINDGSGKERGKKAAPFFTRIPAGKMVLTDLFLFSLLYQADLIFRIPLLYDVLKALFVCGMVLLLAGVLKLFKEHRLFLFCIAFIILMRVPFYVHSDGMMLTSDNALEALQSQEIQDAKTVPFFLLDSSGHNGTWKYFCVAFLWDFLGSRYLYFVLFQLLIFIGFLYLFYERFRQQCDRKIVLLFMLTSFAFIEVILDYSLFLRAGPYMEMLFFFILGVTLFDFALKDRARLFLSFYFIGFTVYLHPMALFFTAAFVLCVLVYVWKSRGIPKNLILLLGGVLAGSCHLIYYKLFYPKPISAGGWYKTVFLSLTDLSLAQVPKLLWRLLLDFKRVFVNLFSFEFTYSADFFHLEGIARSLYATVSCVAVLLSFAVFVCALILSIRRILRLGKEKLSPQDWSHIFFLLLLAIIIVRLFLLSPKPFYEPRHNIDLAVLVMMAYLRVFSAFYKIKKAAFAKAFLLVAFLLTLTFPHYQGYLKSACFKESSYREILAVLEENRVRYLSTDFIIAYPIYFLSERRIKVSDSLGPVTIPFFYPDLKAYVDKIPDTHKAYLFFSDDHPREEGHKRITNFKKMRLLIYLQREKVKYKAVKLKYYTIIIPDPARLLDKSG